MGQTRGPTAEVRALLPLLPWRWTPGVLSCALGFGGPASEDCPHTCSGDEGLVLLQFSQISGPLGLGLLGQQPSGISLAWALLFWLCVPEQVTPSPSVPQGLACKMRVWHYFHPLLLL